MRRLAIVLTMFLMTGLACSAAAPPPAVEPQEPSAPRSSCDDNPRDGCRPSCVALPEGLVSVDAPPSTPPYHGTLFLTPDIITEADPTSFRGLTHQGSGMRKMYDRRTASWERNNAHLFDARFGSSVVVEIQVNPELTQEEAAVLAETYATIIGRIPAFYFTDLETVWIHKGDEAFGGGNNNFLIHTERGAKHIEEGLIEEAFLHEGGHTSLDSHHAGTALWRAAAEADGVAISKYARERPDTEDISETIGPWLAVRFRAERLDPAMVQTLQETVPNRFEYWDCQGLSMDILE